MSNAVLWICPTCNTSVATPYCPACGERPPASDRFDAAISLALLAACAFYLYIVTGTVYGRTLALWKRA